MIFIMISSYTTIHAYTLIDKSPQLVEFVAQIKSSADTAQLFESIQADATVSMSSSAGTDRMDLS